jgi:hypothetical protein
MYLSLELHECHVHTKAVVRVTYPFVGMGLEFVEMTVDNIAKLERMLGELAGTAQPCSEPARMKPGRLAMELPAITDTVAAIDAVIKRFQESDHLSREEFVALVRDSQSRSNL